MFILIMAFLHIIGDNIKSCCSELLGTKGVRMIFIGYSLRSLNKSFSVISAIGERSAIDPKLLDPSMGFPGCCRGIARATVQMFGIFALFTGRL